MSFENVEMWLRLSELFIVLRLVPSILLTFVHDQPNEMGNYLKDELLILIQEM